MQRSWLHATLCLPSHEGTRCVEDVANLTGRQGLVPFRKYIPQTLLTLVNGCKHLIVSGLISLKF